MPETSSSASQPEERLSERSSDLVTLLSRKVVDQSAATKAIVPYIYMYQSGLAPEGRPAGVFLLPGPTGKTCQRRPGVVLLDYVLNEDDGLQLALEFQQQAPLTHIILMTGGGFAEQAHTICEEHDFPILYKPFLAPDLLNLIRGRCGKASAAGVP